MVSSVSGDISVDSPAVALVVMSDERSEELVASPGEAIVIMAVVREARLAEPEASMVATASPDSLYIASKEPRAELLASLGVPSSRVFNEAEFAINLPFIVRSPFIAT